MKAQTAIGLLLLASAMVAAAAPQPTIDLSTKSVLIPAPLGGPNPSSPSIVVLKNTGSGKLHFTAESQQPAWLSVTPDHGTVTSSGSQDLKISVDVTGLSEGDHFGSILVKDPEATVTQETINVTLKITGTPRISITPGSLSFSSPVGTNPAFKTLTVQNTGGGSLDWSATSTSWINLDATEGSLGAGASKSVKVSIDVSGLTAGIHPGSIIISSNAAPDQTVNVTLTLNDKAKITLTPASLTFDAPVGGTNPPGKQSTLKNEGGEALGWKAKTDSAWLAVAPLNGNLNPSQTQQLTITVNTTGLLEGTYIGTVTVDENALAIPSGTISVTLNMNSQPKIGVNPSTLSFSVHLGGSSSPSGISVTNAGSGTLNWKSSGNASWLRVKPLEGVLDSLESEPILLSADSKGLAPGTYTTTLTIADPAASNTSELITVEMNVKESSLPVDAPAGQCGLLGMEGAALILLLRGWRTRRGGRS
jgi:hypothetical protein